MAGSQEMLETLWKERLITRVMLQFARALDTGDWPAYQACFTDPVSIDFQRLTGFEEVRVSAALWTHFAKTFQTPMRRHHAYSNFSIDLDGPTAQAHVYFAARTWRATDIGQSNYAQYGWYDVAFVEQGATWRIGHLKHDFQWVEGNAGVVNTQDSALLEAMQQVFDPAHIQAAKAHRATGAE